MEKIGKIEMYGIDELEPNGDFHIFRVQCDSEALK